MSPAAGEAPSFRSTTSGSTSSRVLGLRESNQALAELKTKLEFALSRLSDQDTQRSGIEEIREFLQTLDLDWFPMVISCIGEAGANLKPLGRCESVKLLGLLAELHGEAVVPLLHRILQVVVTRLQDADLHLREACAETVFRLARSLVDDVEGSPVFATLLKPLFGALGEHNKWVQIGAAACICSVIQGSPPLVIRENLGRLCSRLVQHLSLPLAMAKPQLLSACIYAMQAVEGADFDEVLPGLMPCLETCLQASSDWQTRKQGIEVLQVIGDNPELGLSLELPLPAGASRPTPLQRRIAAALEAVKADKVRAVREAAKDCLSRWSITRASGLVGSAVQPRSASPLPAAADREPAPRASQAVERPSAAVRTTSPGPASGGPWSQAAVVVAHLPRDALRVMQGELDEDDPLARKAARDNAVKAALLGADLSSTKKPRPKRERVSIFNGPTNSQFFKRTTAAPQLGQDEFSESLVEEHAPASPHAESEEASLARDEDSESAPEPRGVRGGRGGKASVDRMQPDDLSAQALPAPGRTGLGTRRQLSKEALSVEGNGAEVLDAREESSKPRAAAVGGARRWPDSAADGEAEEEPVDRSVTPEPPFGTGRGRSGQGSGPRPPEQLGAARPEQREAAALGRRGERQSAAPRERPKAPGASLADSDEEAQRCSPARRQSARRERASPQPACRAPERTTPEGRCALGPGAGADGEGSDGGEPAERQRSLREGRTSPPAERAAPREALAERAAPREAPSQRKRPAREGQGRQQAAADAVQPAEHASAREGSTSGAAGGAATAWPWESEPVGGGKLNAAGASGQCTLPTPEDTEFLINQLETLSERLHFLEEEKVRTEEQLVGRLNQMTRACESQSEVLNQQQEQMDMQERRLQMQEQQLKLQEQRLQRQEKLLQQQAQEFQELQVRLRQQEQEFEQQFEQQDQQLREHEQILDQQEQQLEEHKAALEEIVATGQVEPEEPPHFDPQPHVLQRGREDSRGSIVSRQASELQGMVSRQASEVQSMVSRQASEVQSIDSTAVSGSAGGLAGSSGDRPNLGLGSGLLQVSLEALGVKGTSPKKAGLLWERVTELCSDQRFLEAYKQAIAEPEESCLLKLMRHTGPIVERLDAESNSRLIRRLIHILSSPSKDCAAASIEQIFAWLRHALALGIHFTASQVEDLAAALQRVSQPQSSLLPPARAEASQLLVQVAALRRP